MSETEVLILDAQNLLHRSRSGFQRGENAVIYNFFRSLRPIVAGFEPSTVYLVLEGHPGHRLQMHPEYKGTRESIESLQGGSPEDLEKAEGLRQFFKQCTAAVEMARHLPINIVRDSHAEADDTIATVVKRHQTDNSVVVSTDTDFIQLISDRVRLYNPVKKSYVDAVNYDYVAWKALVGDSCDNIKGIKGVGPKTAVRMLSEEAFFQKKMPTPEHLERYELNKRLIMLRDDCDIKFESYADEHDMRRLRYRFRELDMESIAAEKPWKRFEATFAGLIS